MELKYTFCTLFCLVLKIHAIAQAGCQDPLAINFNPNATSTNSTCDYPTTNAPLATRISSLPAILKESSALLIVDGKVFTINDSGNQADLFEIDSTTGQIIKTTRIRNYSNTDWEDLAADSAHIYIGDFGNNNGSRTNLRILKVRKSAVYNPDSVEINAERLNFNYPDQNTFIANSTHNFDCESLFFLGGRLHLFSKNRGNRKTKHYSLNPDLPSQTAILHDSLNANGLITSGSVSKDGKIAALLGNDQAEVFVWILFGYEGTDFFGGNRRRIELPSFFLTGQAEGIGFVSNTKLWISNEALGNILPMVKELDISGYVNPIFTESPDLKTKALHSNVYPNPASDFISLKLQKSEKFQILNPFGKLIMEGTEEIVDVSKLTSGLYFVKIMNKEMNLTSMIQPLIIEHK